MQIFGWGCFWSLFLCFLFNKLCLPIAREKVHKTTGAMLYTTPNQSRKLSCAQLNAQLYDYFKRKITYYWERMKCMEEERKKKRWKKTVSTHKWKRRNERSLGVAVDRKEIERTEKIITVIKSYVYYHYTFWIEWFLFPSFALQHKTN